MKHTLQFISPVSFLLCLLLSCSVYATDDSGANSVTLKGAFKNAGEYQLRSGETLGQLILRTGGLEPEAYPFGAVLIRERVTQQLLANKEVRLSEMKHIRAAPDHEPIDQQLLDLLTELLANAQPLGRVVVEADPSLLEVAPQKDTLLLPGDLIYIPERTTTVSVLGVVANPSVHLYDARADVMDYIDKAGGLLSGADNDAVRILLPNGEVITPKINWWNYQLANIPPGSSIIVPRDPDYFDSQFAELLVDMEVQLLMEMAQSID